MKRPIRGGACAVSRVDTNTIRLGRAGHRDLPGGRVPLARESDSGNVRTVCHVPVEKDLVNTGTGTTRGDGPQASDQIPSSVDDSPKRAGAIILTGRSGSFRGLPFNILGEINFRHGPSPFLDAEDSACRVRCLNAGALV